MNVLMAIFMEKYMFANMKVKKFLADAPTLAQQGKQYFQERSKPDLESILGDLENDGAPGHYNDEIAAKVTEDFTAAKAKEEEEFLAANPIESRYPDMTEADI